MPPSPAPAAALATLALAALLGLATCGVQTEEPSWDPPTAAEERVERMKTRANVPPEPQARAPGPAGAAAATEPAQRPAAARS